MVTRIGELSGRTLGKLGAYRQLFARSREARAGSAPSAVRPARVVGVASGKGGTGKSVVATNLACLRARAGERVAVVDFDAGLANVHLLLGLAPEHDLADVLRGRVGALEALAEGPEGIAVLSGGVGRDLLLNPGRRQLDRLFRALAPLESAFDLVVVDHGAGLGYATLAQLAAGSALVLVTSHEAPALSDAYALYKRSRLLNPGARVGLVVNRAPSLDEAGRARERFERAAWRFLDAAPEWLGWIPADGAVGRSVEGRLPVVLADAACAASRALEDVAGWEAIDGAVGAVPFFERARTALR